MSGVWAQEDEGLDRRTLADQVADAILNDIIDQRLAPGTPLPSERLLAERFEVNRLVIREATRTLVAREFLDSGQGRPARVRLPSGSTLAQVLRFHLLLEEVAPGDVLRARHLIETELASDAARTIAASAGDVDRIAAVLATMEVVVDDAELFVQRDLEFHREIAELSGNRLFALLLAGLESLLLEVRRLSYASSEQQGEGQRRAIEHHRHILAAIADGDPDRARAAMQAHIDQTADDIRNLAADGRDTDG